MDKAERVHYEQQVESFVEENKLGDYFEMLTKQLVLNQPDDPIQFLIDFLQSRRSQRIIFITGVADKQRNDTATSIANYMNYYEIKVDKLVGRDNTSNNDLVNETVYRAIQETEKHYRGIIVSGYPNNFTQSLYIQHKGVLAERVYILNFSHQQMLDHFNVLGAVPNVEGRIQDAVFQLQEVQDMYSGYCDSFDCSVKLKEDILEIMKGQLKLKDHRIPPLRSPRVVLITPPYLKKRSNEIFEILSNKYGFHSIKLESLIEDHIRRKTEVGKYLQRNKRAQLPQPNDIITALIRTEMQKPVARHKGWLVEGFPVDKEQLGVFKSYKLNPHLVIILDDDEEKFQEQYKDILVDPLFNQKYEIGLQLDPETQNRLEMDPTQPEEWKEVIAQYRQYVKEVEQLFENRTQRFRLGKETTEKIIKSVDVFINNPKIYS